MSVSTLSRVQRDLLANDSHPYALLPPDDEKRVNNVAAYKKNPEAPKHLVASRNDHELISDHSRMRQTVANAIDERRMLGGDAFAEHFIRELASASMINRGPPGISNSSHLHWDLLLGRDETIEPCDYLSFDYDAKF